MNTNLGLSGLDELLGANYSSAISNDSVPTTSNSTQTEDIDQNTHIPQIPIELICLPKKQPRRYFDPHAHKELVSSVRQHGILQPLLVRTIDGDKYELVAGERRLRAAKEAGLTEVPVVIKEFDDTTAFLVAVIENTQREDLNIVDETEGIVQILAIKLGCSSDEVPRILHRWQQERKDTAPKTSPYNVIGTTKDEPQSPNKFTDPQLKIIEQVFTALGKLTWESFTCNRLPLLNLKEDILFSLRQGRIEYTKAKLINRIQDDSSRIDFLSQAIKENWSLADIKERIKPFLETQKSPKILFPAHLQTLWDEIIPQVKKAKVWDDANKQKRLSELLESIQSLIQEQQAS